MNRGWYSGSVQLPSGKTLTVAYYLRYKHATFHDPEEWDTSDDRYFIDNVAVDDEDLPEEVTPEIVERAKSLAEYDPSLSDI